MNTLLESKYVVSPWARSNAPKEKKNKLTPTKTPRPPPPFSPTPFNPLVLSGCRTFRLMQDRYRSSPHAALKEEEKKEKRSEKKKKVSPRCHYSPLSNPIYIYANQVCIKNVPGYFVPFQNVGSNFFFSFFFRWRLRRVLCVWRKIDRKLREWRTG